MNTNSDDSLILKESTIGLLKSAISAIPLFGGAINEILFEIAGRIHQKRINDFVIQLSNQVNEIESNKIDLDYLKSENFYDLTRTIFESVIKIKSKEKHLALSKVYINAILEKSDLEQDFSILFSKYILDLIPLQIQILCFIEQNEEKLIEIGSYEKFYDLFVANFKYTDLDKYEFKYSCNDLVNKILISFGHGLDDFDSTVEYITTNKSKNASVKLTTIGNKFSEFLK